MPLRPGQSQEILIEAKAYDPRSRWISMRHWNWLLGKITLVLSAGTFLVPSYSYSFEVDINAFYSSDALSAASEFSESKILYDLSALIPIDKRARWLAGWSYMGVSISDSGSSDRTYSSTDMGPKLVWYMNKKKNWIIGVTYNLLVTAKYNDGTSEVEWRGSSIKAEVGYLAQIGESETQYIGGKLNYYQSTLNEALDSSSNFSEVSYSRSLIYPSLSYNLRF